MAKWESELQRILELSEHNAQLVDKFETRCGNVLDSAQSFIGVHAKGAGKASRCLADMQDAAEEAGRAVAELSVYEEEYEDAKKAKNKDKMKELDDKMKPLVKSFEAAKKRHNGFKDELKKTLDEVYGEIETLGAASVGWRLDCHPSKTSARIQRRTDTWDNGKTSCRNFSRYSKTIKSNMKS